MKNIIFRKFCDSPPCSTKLFTIVIKAGAYPSVAPCGYPIQGNTRKDKAEVKVAGSYRHKRPYFLVMCDPSMNKL